MDVLIGWMPSGAPAKRPARAPATTQAARVVAYLGAHADAPVGQEELCRLLDVSARSLRSLFERTFRCSPARYLRLRRLHLARRALRSGRYPTVTEVAVHFGFYDVGRFAGRYRALFGELPSETLAAIGPRRWDFTGEAALGAPAFPPAPDRESELMA